jgi:hypothetical protein
LALSALIAFVVYSVVFGHMPVRLGRGVGGPALSPAVAGVFVAVTAGVILYWLWKDVTLADFKPGKSGAFQSLLGGEPDDNRRANRDESSEGEPGAR